MAYVSVGGIRGIQWPSLPMQMTSLTLTSSILDATGEKLAWTGYVATPGMAAKSIRKIGFLFGSVTKAGGSAMTLSLQDWSGSGPPVHPDGTQDQTVAIANADSGFVTNGFYLSGNLSADRAVNNGDKLAVVLEFDGSGRLGSDDVRVRNTAATVFDSGPMIPGVQLYTGSWANVGVLPIVMFENSDGTFSTLYGANPVSNQLQQSYGSGSNPDEHGNVFTLPWACKSCGCWVWTGASNATSDYDVILYDGTTPIATVSIDSNQVNRNNSTSTLFLPWSSEVTLAAQTYRLIVKPTTTGSVFMHGFDVSAAGHMALHDMGTAIYATNRVDGGGSWTDVTTRRWYCGLNISAIDIGSASGGFKRHSGMAGGFRA